MTDEQYTALKSQIVAEISAVVLKELHAMEQRIITGIARTRLGDPS